MEGPVTYSASRSTNFAKGTMFRKSLMEVK